MDFVLTRPGLTLPFRAPIVTDSKCRVSDIAFQSSSEISTALPLFPVITTGWCVSAASSIRLYSLALASVAFTIVRIINPFLVAVRQYVRQIKVFKNIAAVKTASSCSLQEDADNNHKRRH